MIFGREPDQVGDRLFGPIEHRVQEPVIGGDISARGSSQQSIDRNAGVAFRLQNQITPWQNSSFRQELLFLFDNVDRDFNCHFAVQPHGTLNSPSDLMGSSNAIFRRSMV